MLRSLALLLFPLLIGLANPADARVYCPLPEDGIWINPNPAPKEISRIEVETKCADDQVHARIRAFTSCIPRDCKWGWTAAEEAPGGGLRVLLIGFLSSKVITVRRFGDMLDTHVLSFYYDRTIDREEETYNLVPK